MQKIIPLLLIPFSLHAEIVTDGSLGRLLNLPGPNFQVDANLGQQHGTNLFHSFQDFNLQSHESATFSGPNGIENVISRVTGGQPSNIDGLIRSTIPNANLYFLNPYGILLGENAQLDVQGSFYASTADYLRLGSTGTFNARQPNDSVLTVAPVEAFGFLTDSPTALSVEGSQLSTPVGDTLSLISGDLTIKNAQLSAPNGRLNLISVAETGEINTTLETQALTQQGTIQLTEQAKLDVSGPGGGKIFIRGGRLLVADSTIQADTLGDEHGQGIDMQLTESIEIKGKSTEITSNTFGAGAAGNIVFSTPELTIYQSKVLSDSFGQGAAGNISADTLQTSLHEGGMIVTDSFATGDAGNVTIKATQGVFIIDKRIFLEKETADFFSQLSSAAIGQGKGGSVKVSTSQLVLEGASIVSQSHAQGDAGEIIVAADTIELRNGGLISATTFSQSSGKGGNITLKVKDTIRITSFRPGFAISTTDTFENMQSAVAAISFGSGNAGNVEITANKLILENEGSIGAASAGTGDAGDITITVDELRLKDGGLLSNSSGGMVGGKLFLSTGASGTITIKANNITASGYGHFAPSSIISNTLVSGQGGNINIETDSLRLTEGATLSANSLGVGNAGALNIQANTIHLTNGGNITTSAEEATGGNITVTMDSEASLLYLQKAQITTSVGTGKGKGGDITLEQPLFVVLDKGLIKAQADEGQGGDIHIKTRQLITSPDSLVNASSRLGIDGKVTVDGLNENISDSLVVLSTEILDKNTQLEDPCQARRQGEKASHFYVDLNDNLTASAVHDLQGSQLMPPTDLQKMTTVKRGCKTGSMPTLLHKFKKPGNQLYSD